MPKGKRKTNKAPPEPNVPPKAGVIGVGWDTAETPKGKRREPEVEPNAPGALPIDDNGLPPSQTAALAAPTPNGRIGIYLVVVKGESAGASPGKSILTEIAEELLAMKDWEDLVASGKKPADMPDHPDVSDPGWAGYAALVTEARRRMAE